ncbi:hypothetical protein J3E72DRAFT_383602 [Bipolaris maydis]|uniref:uncharacterized protein n=1 Tax=Cochliobolus heterostrophus TaxID=5016 RepID=UPI0024D9C265|nr:hypothetical protein BM1_03202 [Bipolaris maydis]KAJ5030925.1 hypothetical protein J3E73DRAFT_378894 [Bipolaris maydis]KAJ5065948.1 hypothetical protein J3E74DRAFT_414862 [Bipolaris maydis]KAJ6201144.1 hypothetical protein J3E72DRAFT_383602 [Bipolaris maydis]KAJ6274240.1 hypothetical protein PSV08DRAFT_358619 [Bipolaris maydis]
MAPTTHSAFLDMLPPELRINIYSHLLVASTPLKGQLARQDKTYDLHTAILRTNRQIHHEARSVFFGKNTFYITSIPPSSSPLPPPARSDSQAGGEHDDDYDEEQGSGAFEPPLQLRDLPLVRHLEIDLLYYPRSMQTIRDRRTGIWKPVCVGAQRYSTSLSYLLSAVETRLLSLKLCADTRRYLDETVVVVASVSNDSSSSSSTTTTTASAGDDIATTTSNTTNTASKDNDDRLEAQRILTGFYMADTNPLFRKALARLHVADMALHFDFPESYFDFVVLKKVLCRQNLVELAGQVLDVRSDIRFKAAAKQDAGADDAYDIPDQGAVTLIPAFAFSSPSSSSSV